MSIQHFSEQEYLNRHSFKTKTTVKLNSRFYLTADLCLPFNVMGTFVLLHIYIYTLFSYIQITYIKIHIQ